MIPLRPMQPPPTPANDGQQHQPWLMSFADFISCLLACFVLLFSMVSLDHDKFQILLGSIPGRAHLDLEAPQPVERGMVAQATDPARSPNYLLTLLRGSFEKDPKLASLGLVGTGDRVVVALPTSTLVRELGAGGGAKKDGLLFALAGALRSFPNEIVVQGQGVGIDDPERWGNLLALAQMSAAAIEQAGVSGPIPVRAELSPGSDMQVNVIITERAADTTP
jgi:hypothetical protein